jgi:hypothetical protein
VQIIENHLLECVLWAGHHVGQLCANDTRKIIYHYGTFVGMHFDHSFSFCAYASQLPYVNCSLSNCLFLSCSYLSFFFSGFDCVL